MDDFLRTFVNKQVNWRYAGRTLQLSLSQSLFSSFEVDAGTRLLLKTLAQELDLRAVQSALDVGCGVGVIGLSLRAANPALRVHLQDRDALALAFARHNAAQNGLDDTATTAAGELALAGAGSGRFDLVVSNLPGKAGEPVLAHLLRQMPAHLTPDGRAAVVVVRPLAALVHDTLLAAGCELLAQARGGDHWVTHFRGGTAVPPEPPADPLAPYVRGQFSFKVGQTSYQLTAVYNLPEFDTLSHDTRLAISTLRGERVAGRVLVWNPGQGHVPVYLRQRFGRQIAHYVLAGRDLLSLHVSAHNLRAHGVPEAHITRLHLPHLLAVRGPFDWAVVFPDGDAGVPWAERLLPGCAEWLGENGRLLLTTRSTFAHRLLAQPHPFRKRQDRKRHGYRTLLLQLTAPAL